MGITVKEFAEQFDKIELPNKVSIGCLILMGTALLWLSFCFFEKRSELRECESDIQEEIHKRRLAESSLNTCTSLKEQAEFRAMNQDGDMYAKATINMLLSLVEEERRIAIVDCVKKCQIQ